MSDDLCTMCNGKSIVYDVVYKEYVAYFCPMCGGTGNGEDERDYKNWLNGREGTM